MLIRMLTIGAIATVAFYLLRAVWIHAVDRGWVYGKDGPARGNAVGGLGFEQVFQPSVEHVIEEQQRLQIEADHNKPSDGRGTRTTPEEDSQ